MKRLVPLAAALVLAVSLPAAFHPPTAEDRTAALGDIASEPLALRRLLAPDDDYGLIPLPAPGDWLDRRTEPGQSYAEFVDAHPNQPDATRRIIYLLPIGDFTAGSSPSLAALRQHLADFFQLETKILPAAQIELTQFTPRVHPQTKQLQLLTSNLLEFLRHQLPPDAYCLLGITMQDLYPQASWNYVFGQASLRSRVGIFSFARFDPEFFGEVRPDDFRRLMLRRSVKVTTHEAGHMFGLAHCVYYDCALNGSNHLAESDARTLHLCPVCLRKLHHSIGFDVIKRYQDLARFYHTHGYVYDAEWCEQQVAKAKSATL